jgi:hypothetical protein
VTAWFSPLPLARFIPRPGDERQREDTHSVPNRDATAIRRFEEISRANAHTLVPVAVQRAEIARNWGSIGATRTVYRPTPV